MTDAVRDSVTPHPLPQMLLWDGREEVKLRHSAPLSEVPRRRTPPWIQEAPSMTTAFNMDFFKNLFPPPHEGSLGGTEEIYGARNRDELGEESNRKEARLSKE